MLVELVDIVDGKEFNIAEEFLEHNPKCDFIDAKNIENILEGDWTGLQYFIMSKSP